MTKNSDENKKSATKSMKLLIKSKKIDDYCYYKKIYATWNKKLLATATSNFENFPPYKNG
jgi:hypothetical protein